MHAGHDFRPAYRRLARLRQEFQRVPLMALTATATKEVSSALLMMGPRAYGPADQGKDCFTFSGPNGWD